MVDVLSRFTLNGNQENTQEFPYKREIASEINDTEELPEGILPNNLKLNKQYQQKDSYMKAKYDMGM